jgi:Bax protein
MLMLGRNPRYLDFRKARFETDDPYELIKHLKNYSELRDEYIRRLRIVIKVNNLTKFDKEIKDSDIIDIEM